MTIIKVVLKCAFANVHLSMKINKMNKWKIAVFFLWPCLVKLVFHSTPYLKTKLIPKKSIFGILVFRKQPDLNNFTIRNLVQIVSIHINRLITTPESMIALTLAYVVFFTGFQIPQNQIQVMPLKAAVKWERDHSQK